VERDDSSVYVHRFTSRPYGLKVRFVRGYSGNVVQFGSQLTKKKIRTREKNHRARVYERSRPTDLFGDQVNQRNRNDEIVAIYSSFEFIATEYDSGVGVIVAIISYRALGVC